MRLSLLLASTALFVIARPPSASAACAGDCWTGVGGDWFTSSAWTAGTPDGATHVIINQSNGPFIGFNNVSNAAASAAVEIASLPGSAGLVDLSTQNAHAASWTVNGTLSVGEAGTGELDIFNPGTTLTTKSQTLLGDQAGAKGQLVVIGSLWNAQANAGAAIGSAPIIVGNSGSGVLGLIDGATVQTTGQIGNVVVGMASGSNGLVIVGGSILGNDPSISTLANNGPAGAAGSLLVGYGGTGTMFINDHGEVSGFADVALGSLSGSSGTVTVDGGHLDVSSVTVGEQGVGTLTVSNGGSVSANGGTGSVFVADGSNSVGTINIGAAKGSAAAAPGTISASQILFGNGNGNLVFNHTSSSYSFGTSIQGAGSVDVESGTTILTASSTYTGATTINSGALFVDGSIANSTATVNAGGMLGGSGVVGNTLINGGTLAPGSLAGSAFGPLTVQGNLSFTAASTYMIQVNPATAGLTNVTGVATLGGATVNAVFSPGSYVSRQYTILTAAGGVSGAFAPTVVVSNAPGFRSFLSYDANDVFLNLGANLGGGGGLGGNQQRIATRLNNFFNNGGALPPGFVTLFGLTGSNLSNALAQTAGELGASPQQTTFNAMSQFMGVLTDPFAARDGGPGTQNAATGFADEDDQASAYASRKRTDAFAFVTKAPPAAFVPRWSVWAAGFGGSQSTDGNAAVGSNDSTSRIFGTAVGADYRFTPNTLAGIALAGGGTSFSLANGLGSGRSDLFQAGAYLRHNEGPAYVTAALAYGWQDISTDRNVTIAGLDHLHAEFNANAYSGRVEGGYRFVAPLAGGVGITPYAAGTFTTVDLPAYAEQAISGANTFALSYGAKNVTDPRSELGLRTDKSFAMQGGILTLRGRAAWAHDFDPDRTIAATFQALPVTSFVVNGAAQARESALTTASAEMKWMSGWSLAATFEGEFSIVTRSYAGKGELRYAW